MPAVFEKMRKIEPLYNFVYSVFMLICKLLLVAVFLLVSSLSGVQTSHLVQRPRFTGRNARPFSTLTTRTFG